MIFFRILFITVCSLGLLSCSISDRWVHEDSEGVVSEEFFSTIKKNKTQQSWLIQNLGQPHVVSEGPRGEEVFTYRFKRTRYRQANILFLLRLNSSQRDLDHYHVVFCKGIVRKAWWDTLPDVQVSKISRWSGCKDKPSMMADTISDDHSMKHKADMAVVSEAPVEQQEDAGMQKDQHKTKKEQVTSDNSKPKTMGMK